MQNFWNSEFNLREIKKSLPFGDIEQGEVFYSLLMNLIYPNGVFKSNVEEIQLTSKKWREVARDPNKTAEADRKLDEELFEEVEIIAQSLLIYILKEVKSSDLKIDYKTFEKFMLEHRFKENVFNGKVIFTQEEIAEKIKNAFVLISSGGFLETSDNLIDLEDIKVFVYALLLHVQSGKNDEFEGFNVNGLITAEEFSINEAFLFRTPDKNMFRLKLEMANRKLNNNWEE